MSRAMLKDEDDKPTVGQGFCQLGARPTEIDLDAQGNAMPTDKGMSVAPEWCLLPFVVLPRRLDPRGRCTKPVHCFRRGTGQFQQMMFGNNLELVPDPPDRGVVKHGIVRPAQAVPVADHQQNLGATRAEWEIDEQ
jgi:hypothetical protein